MKKAAGKKVRELRDRLRISQEQTAARAGISRRAYQSVEAGKQVKHETLVAIAGALGVEVHDLVDEDGDVDSFSNWPWSLSRYINDKISLSGNSFCNSQTDVAEAISAMRGNWTEHLKRTEESSRDGEYFKANDNLRRDFDQFENRYCKIWAKNREAVVYSTSKNTRTGLSVVLPVTDSAFTRFRDGEITFMDIGADDILPESQNLILDSCAELPCDESVAWYRITDSLSYTVFFHIAMMCKNPVAEDFRMLGFAASPTNLKRLCDAGFASIGTAMPRYGFELCEFGASSSHQSAETVKRSSTTSHYVKLFKMFSLNKKSRSTKTRMVCRFLRLIQSAAKDARRSRDVMRRRA